MRPYSSDGRDGAGRVPTSRWSLVLLLVAVVLATTAALSLRQHHAATAQGVEADLWVLKAGESWKWPESSPFRYELTVRNDGPDAAANVTVNDTMPDGMQFVSATSPQVPDLHCDQSGQTVSCFLGTVPNQGGGTETWTVWVDVITPPVSGDLVYVTNVVSIMADTPDPQMGDNHSSDEIWVQNVTTDLWLDKSGPSTVYEDIPFSYDLTVVGDASWPATGVVLRDHLPDGVAFVSADAPCTYEPGLVTCAIGELGNNEQRTYRVTVTATGYSASVTNTATVASSTEDPDLADNTDNVQTGVLPQVTHLQIDKVGPTQAVAGGEVDHTITLHNAGTFTARQVLLYDQPPAGWALVGSGTLPCVQHVFGTGQIDCEVGDIPAGATHTSTLTLRAPIGQPTLPETAVNSAWYTMATPDTDPTNNYDSAATTVLPTVPTAPRNVTVGPAGAGQVHVSWWRPEWTGGTAVTSCTVTASPGGASAVTNGCAGDGGGDLTITGLTPGVTYTFTVRATNAVGPGPASESSDPILVYGPPPDPPTDVTATAGDGEATVFWTLPANTGASWPVGYTVIADPGGLSVSVGEATSAVVPGLTNGTTYTFRVRATNPEGEGPWSEPSNPVTPLGLPGAPTGVTAVAGNTSAQVSWSPPTDDGGSPITGYRIRVSGGRELDASASPTTVSGLVNGTAYTFQVAARNVRGLGPWSSPSSSVTPQSLPGAPTGAHASAGDHLALVSWAPPLDDGGFPIASYTVSSSPGGPTVVVSTTSTTITGLTNGVAYTFSIRATTSVGSGPAAITAPVTPAGLPGVPATVTGTPLVEAVQVTWTAADPNGSPVTHYDLERQPGGVTTVPATPPSTTVDGLSPLTAYAFRVRARNSVGTGGWSTWSTAVIPAAPPARFFALSNPDRILDTRTSPVPVGYPSGKRLPGGSHLDLQVTGVAGVPSDASAVVLNVTAVVPSAPTHLTVWPTGQPMPKASNLNVGTGEVAANLVIVKLGDGGRVSIFNNSGDVHVVADVTGYDADDPAGSLLTGVQPKRLVDSRDGTGTPKRPWDPASTRNVTIAGGTTTVPSGATAVVLDVTAVWPTAPTHLTVWPTGQPMPWVSNLNLPANDIRPNLVIVRVGTNRQISIYNNSGKVDVVADVVAYFDATATNGLFTGVQPVRVLDSRDGTGGYSSPWGPATSRPVTVTGGTTTVPPGATAVVVNLTAVLPEQDTHLTVWPTGQPLPWVSNLNLGPGDVRPNLVVVKVGDGGQISIYNNSGRVAVVADIVGYYGGP